MKHGSFTLKIALHSVLLSGLVLLAFGGAFLSVILQISYQRIDDEITHMAEPLIRGPQGQDHWSRFEWFLRSAVGEDKAQQFIVKIFDRDGKTAYTSSHWPAGLADKLLPKPGAFVEQKESMPPPSHPFPRHSHFDPPESLFNKQPPGPDGFEQHDATRPPPPSSQRPPHFGPPGEVRNMRMPVYATLNANGNAWRIAAMGSEQFTMIIGKNLAELHTELGRYRNAFLIAAPTALLLLFAAGLLLARQALQPVQIIAQTTGSITAQRLSQRVSYTSTAREFQHLIQVINGMLERLEQSFQQASRFSADAAHELKTPLTILQSQIEHALQTASDASPEQQTYTAWLEEVQRLKAIVRKLLLLAQADSGRLQMTLTRVNFSELVESAVDDIQIIAPQLSLRTEIAKDVSLEADADLLNQVLRNLTSNAVKFNENKGQIEMQLQQLSGVAALTVANTGQTIPPEDFERVFQRFYRADKSRGRQVDGVGLGLSLSREIARAHRGDLILQNTRPGWTEFVLTLPTSPGHS